MGPVNRQTAKEFEELLARGDIAELRRHQTFFDALLENREYRRAVSMNKSFALHRTSAIQTVLDRIAGQRLAA